MGIDETRTFEALAKFNAYSANPEGEKQVLKVCEDSKGRYLALVPKSKMGPFERFLKLFNASNFSLTKVLDVANQAAQKDSEIEGRGEILKTVSIILSKRVAKAHDGQTEQKKVNDKMVKIHDLVLTKTGFSALKKTFKEEALKQDIAQGPFRAVKPPAYDQLLSIWSEALVDTGLGKIVTQKIKEQSSPKEILEAIVTHIESNPDPRIKQVGEAMKEACDALIDQENKKPSPVPKDKRHIKDSTAFVVDMFMLRQPMKFLQAAFPKEPNKASPIHQEFAKQFKAYANQKAVDADWGALFDRLAVALTGSKPAV